MRTKEKRALRTGRHLGLYLALCLALCLAFAFVSVEAGGIGEAEVRAAVETWVRHVTADARPDAVVERMEPYQVDGETVAYIAHLEGGGFCLCGADDLVLPVYFYSPQGTYDPQNPNYQYILWEIGTRLKTLQRGLEEEDARLQPYQEALSERATFWQELIAGRAPSRSAAPQGTLAEPISMTLPLSSTWHQRTPYNDQCPDHVNSGQRTVVGCVATAMSQVMYYWRWPNQGTLAWSVDYDSRWRNNWDSEPLAVNPNIPAQWAGLLQWTPAGGGALQMNGDWDMSILRDAQGISSDSDYQDAILNLYGRLNSSVVNWPAHFLLTTYQWDLMADDEGQLPPGGDAAVATLCYHAGVAVDMHYGLRGSSASTSKVETALENFFRYDQDAIYGESNPHLMISDILWFRPVVISGRNPNGAGHAWVAFGYNKSTAPDWQFKMNLGWGWDYSSPPYGWYSLDSVPGPQGFNLEQYHVTQIAPDDVVRFVGANSPGDGSPNDPHKNIWEAIMAAPNGATLVFKAGSINTFGGTLVINRPLTLRGWDVIIRKE